MSQYPVDDEVFTLTIATPFTGMEMVRDDGFKAWQEWKFIGQEIADPFLDGAALGVLGDINGAILALRGGRQQHKLRVGNCVR